jgi:hypothetical protein
MKGIRKKNQSRCESLMGNPREKKMRPKEDMNK